MDVAAMLSPSSSPIELHLPTLFGLFTGYQRFVLLCHQSHHWHLHGKGFVCLTRLLIADYDGQTLG